MLRNFLRPKLRSLRVNMEKMWFQQDGATAHTARASMTFIRQMFPQHVVSRFGDVPWPPRSPDLSACDFFLWGYLESKVYVRKPRTVDDLKVSIREEIATVPQGIAIVPQEIATVPQEIAAVPLEIATVPQEIATVPQEIATVPQEIAAVPQEIATVPQEIATVPQEIATVPQEMLVNVMQNFEERLRTRVRQEGRHLSDIIFRK